jgi:general stress protein YciG
MAGTVEGGKKAAATNKERHGEDFYSGIGEDGGRKSRGGGFAKNPELAREAGRKGGLRSKRKKLDAVRMYESIEA